MDGDLLGGLRRRDPGLAATRRALRVAFSASLGFLICRYLVDDVTASVYAAFGAIGFGVLSELVGSPAERVRALGLCLGAGIVLVGLGTAAAASTTAAVVGMLLVGPAVALLSVGGPRLAGLAPGLQLLYILPSFPPYAPDTLGSRWGGLALGLGLLAAAEGLLWPACPPRAFAGRAAFAARALAAHLRALAADAPDLETAREATRRGGEGLRIRLLPWAERPVGPGARERALAHLAAALRSLEGRVLALDAHREDLDTEPALAVARSLDEVAGVLSRGSGRPADAELTRVLAALDARRLARYDARGAGSDDRSAAREDTETVLVETVTTQRLVCRAAGVAVDPPPAVPGRRPDDGPFWYADATMWARWRWRLRANLSPRSVHLQNAVRLGLGLALARLVAGVLDLSHGFWVLLATLTLMRTSVTTTRTGLVRALAGTALGAAAAAGFLTVWGVDHGLDAVVLPLLCLAAAMAGPLLGAVAGQAGFTVLVSVLFVQLAPAGWTLAGARLLDVLVGAAVGLGVGAVVWPRGARGEVARDAAESLAASAEVVVATVTWLNAEGARDAVVASTRRAVRAAGLFEASVAQLATERASPSRAQTDWLLILAVGHRVVLGAQVLAGAPDTPPGVSAGGTSGARATSVPPDEELRAAAERVAADHRTLAAALRDGGTVTRPTAAIPAPTSCGHTARPATRPPPEVLLRRADARGWLRWLDHDLAALFRAVESAGQRVPRGSTGDTMSA